MNCWSKWLDFQLSKFICHMETYVKDYQQILDEIKVLQLPLNAWQFAVDANSMYNNIDTEHTIKLISWWLDKLNTKALLLEDFSLKVAKKAM